jgi:hypothetical protein
MFESTIANARRPDFDMLESKSKGQTDILQSFPIRLRIVVSYEGPSNETFLPSDFMSSELRLRRIASIVVPPSRFFFGTFFACFVCMVQSAGLNAQDQPKDFESTTPALIIDGTGPGWVELGGDDFAKVNTDDDTWTWKGNHVHCTGKPVGVLRSKKIYKNIEFVGHWRHLSSGGNSGFFLWTPPDVLKDLPPNKLPGAGIEVQVLDHGYKERYESSTGKKGDWFSTNGDIFPVGKSKLEPFPPLSPDGSRSFPRSNHSLGTPLWNHYYVRAINGEVRLWVNGHEVSGGKNANPAEGYLCLEAEGAPVEFKQIRVRELP